MCKIGHIAREIFVGALLLNILGQCEMSIYPGLRRRPQQSSLQQSFDVRSDFLAQLMEENARRRLHQQFEQQLELINMQMNRQRQRQEQRERYHQLQLQQLQQQQLHELEGNDAVDINGDNVDRDGYGKEYGNDNNINRKNNILQYDGYTNTHTDFSYKYPSDAIDNDILRTPISFAVGPTDPRFYEDETRIDNDLETQALEDEYEEYIPVESNKQTAVGGLQSSSVVDLVQREITSSSDRDSAATSAVLSPTPIETIKLLDPSSTTTFHRIKPQSPSAVVAAGVPQQSTTAVPSIHLRQDINTLIDKLQKESKSNAVVNNHAAALLKDDKHHVVARQHVGMNGEMGIYIVALIAGVSAAITVGLIVLGIAWYTFHNKIKATADVEYPAYGVTGPNKDISPSGDRKLAQSAQMYHYQHQKQQIIAMENRQTVEESGCGLSDVESDDDNEEGDYTVYECPGLAPTGEMEVKNPLFFDETPMTPSGNVASHHLTAATNTNITQATPQTIKIPCTNTLEKTGTCTADCDATALSSDEKKQMNNHK